MASYWEKEESHETGRLCSPDPDRGRPGASRLQWGPGWARDAEPDSHPDRIGDGHNCNAVACSAGRMPKANSMSGAYGLPASTHLPRTSHVSNLPRTDHVPDLPGGHRLPPLPNLRGTRHVSIAGGMSREYAMSCLPYAITCCMRVVVPLF